MQLSQIPEKFFIEDKMYDDEDFLSYIEELIEDFDSLDELPDDFTEKLYKAELKPVYVFTANELMDLIPEENLPSIELTNSDELEHEIFKLVEKHVVNLNKELPEYWYCTRNYYLMDKNGLIQYYNDNK
jgi:hypothetical protein